MLPFSRRSRLVLGTHPRPLAYLVYRWTGLWGGARGSSAVVSSVSAAPEHMEKSFPLLKKWVVSNSWWTAVCTDCR